MDADKLFRDSAQAARETFAAKVTHWHRISTAHLWLGSTVAACVELVFSRNLVDSPTCPTCRTIKAELMPVEHRKAG